MSWDSLVASKKAHQLEAERARARYLALHMMYCLLLLQEESASSQREQLSPSYLKKNLSGKKEPKQVFTLAFEVLPWLTDARPYITRRKDFHCAALYTKRIILQTKAFESNF